ncbi:MAG: hypothetical protein L0287_05720 [Anaerolineae bacterium]|nr:hypothetical protein [Anaerolineae bacterium]MCI0611194.1 hypothetical protein [Anaerolineae bacterium]
MRSKKIIVGLGILILLVGAAAFIAGRMLNNGVSPLSPFGLMGNGDVMSFAINVIPAPELPTTPPEVLGLFAERQDNTITISAISLEAGGGGVAVDSEGEDVAVGPGSPVDHSGPKVEVVVTSETIIYRETTQLSGPPSAGSETVQQTVEVATLDDLNSQSFVTVWGRKSGDRIIAEVLFYSNPVMIQRP